MIIEVDAENMFLELDRTTIMKVVRERVPELFPLIANLAVPAFVTFFRASLIAQVVKGVNIGSSLASLVAALVEEVEMEKLKAWCDGEGVWVEMMAFIDNIFIVTTAQEAKRILARLEVEGKKVGLRYGLREAHPHKVHFPFPQKLSRQIEDWQKEFEGFEFSAADEKRPAKEQGIKLAGAEMGSKAYYRERADAKMKKGLADMELVTKLATPQEAMIMIRSSILPSFDHLRRMLPRSATYNMAKTMDKAVVEAVQKIAKGPGDWSTDQNKFDWIFQGSGLWGMRRMEFTGEVAEIASFVAAARNRPNLEMPRGVVQSIVDLNTRANTELPKTLATAELLAHVKTWNKVQKRLAKSVESVMARDLRTRLEGQDLMMLDAMQQHRAGVWMKEIDFGTVFDPGMSAEEAISDVEFRYLMRRSMPGLDPHGTGLGELTCAFCLQKYDTRMTHAESSCVSVRGGGRHNAFQAVVMQLVHAMGGFARATELSMLVTPSCENMDALCAGCEKCAKPKSVRVDVEFGGLADAGYYSVDVGNVEVRTKNVKYKTMPKTGRLAVSQPVESKEAEKKKLYDTLCNKKKDREFIAAVMSTFASPGVGVQRLLEVLGERLQRMTGEENKTCEKRILRRLQAVNMREIARNGIQALRDNRKLINLIRERQLKEAEDARKEQEAQVMLQSTHSASAPPVAEVVAVASATAAGLFVAEMHEWF